MSKTIRINIAAREALARSTDGHLVGARPLQDGTLEIDLDDDVFAELEKFKTSTGNDVQDYSDAIKLACSGNFGRA